MQPETKQNKKSFLDSLPKMGRVSQLVLLIGIFLVIFIGLLMLNRQLSTREAGLNGTLTNLQRILSTGGQISQTKYEADLAQATAANEAAKAAYPNPNQAPEILDSLLEIASINNIYVTSTSISSATQPGALGPTLSFTLGLKGQIPSFENFLLALDTKLPTSQISAVTFNASSKEGEYDTASIKIDVLSRAGK